jgi:hypothetical protein
MHQGQCSNLEKRRSRHATTSIFICCFAPRLLAVAARKSQQIILQNIKFVYLSILRPIKCKAGLRSSAQLIIQHTSKKSIFFFSPFLFFALHLLLALRRTLVPENVSFPGVYPLSLLRAKEKQRLKGRSRGALLKKRVQKKIYIYFFLSFSMASAS